MEIPFVRPKPYKNLVSVDVLRVVAMLMVVILHTILNFTIRVDFFSTKAWFILEPVVALSKTGVLLFFMLSGYLVINKNRSLKLNLEKTVKRIIVPLIFFVLLTIFYELSKYGFEQLGSYKYLQDQLARWTDFPNSPLWFLFALAFMYLLNPVWQIIFSKDGGSSLAIYIVKLAAIFSVLTPILKYPSLKSEFFFNVFTGWMAYLFFYLYGGLVYNKWVKYNLGKLNLVLLIVGLLVTMMGDYFTLFAKVHSINFIWRGYFSDYLSIPVVVTAIGLFNWIIGMDLNNIAKKAFSGLLIMVTRQLAVLSYGIYLIHPFVVSYFSDVLGFDFDKLNINVYAYNALNYCLVLGISAVICFLILKIPKVRIVVGG